MSANEISDAIRAQFVFTAANPPVLIRSVGVIQASLTRAGVGAYTVKLEQPVGFGSIVDSRDNVAVHASVNADVGVASFANATTLPASGQPGIGVFTYNAAGAAADTGATISVTVFNLPNRS